MSFPKDSAFGQQNQIREAFEGSEKAIEKMAQREFTMVPMADLENWYATINAVVDHLPEYKLASGSSAKDELYDVRDSIYRLLP